MVDSEESLVDILGYLQQYDQEGIAVSGEMDEEQHLPSPVTEQNYV